MTHSDPVARTALSPSVGPDIWAVLEANLPREEFAYLGYWDYSAGIERQACRRQAEGRLRLPLVVRGDRRCP